MDPMTFAEALAALHALVDKPVSLSVIIDDTLVLEVDGPLVPGPDFANPATWRGVPTIDVLVVSVGSAHLYLREGVFAGGHTAEGEVHLQVTPHTTIRLEDLSED
jgi:hypothetical protein